MIWELLQNKRIRIGLIVFGIFMIVLVMFNILYRSTLVVVTPTNVSFSDTTLTANEDTLRGYNGLFFYKLSTVSNDEPVVLGGGKKLPVITSAVWAEDKGILLNFDQSLIHTEVEDYINKNNVSYDDSFEATWFFDFESNSLQYVNSRPIHENKGYYSKTDNGVYFIAEDHEVSEAGQLNFYDIEEGKGSTVGPIQQLTTVEGFTECAESGGICITGRGSDPTTSLITHISPTNKSTLKKKVNGAIYPINNSSWYVSLHNEDDTTSETHGAEVIYKQYILANTINDEKRVITEPTTPQSFLTLQYDDDSFATFGNNPDRNYTSIGGLFSDNSTSNHALRLASGGSFNDAIVLDDSSSRDQILFQGSEQQAYLLAKNGYVKNSFTVEDVSIVEDKLTKCSERHYESLEFSEEQQGFIIYLTDDAGFDNKLKAISNCLEKQKDTIYGHTYNFMSVDPVNGRVTSY